jgi:hypothetical protein
VATVYVFSDESGNFDFSGGPGASRYFTLATVSGANCQFGDQLLALRRRLAWRGLHLDSMFHATYDHGRIRSEVLEVLGSASVRIDATLFEKTKAPDHLQSEAIYAFAWERHLARVATQIVTPTDRLLVVASELGTKKRRGAFFGAVQAAVSTASCAKRRAAFWPNASDPCLWAADYACWAIQRYYEHGDPGPRATLSTSIRSEEIVWS